MTRLWSETAWKESEKIYNEIISHPFIKELAEGSLSLDKYLGYLRQDRLYLREYARVLANIASRLDKADQSESFLRFALDSILVEREMHSFFLGKEQNNDGNKMTAACALYTSTLKSQAYSPVEVEAAAILPCFVVYLKVGLHILSIVKDLDSNPYKEWIKTYADNTFAESTRRAVEICDALAANASENIRERMTEIFKECTRLEWLFWDSAWRLESPLYHD
ncbi:MAG: thiaminase II [Bacteroides sp.]|nr:thiaminase II [Bacteroides sp.]